MLINKCKSHHIGDLDTFELCIHWVFVIDLLPEGIITLYIIYVLSAPQKGRPHGSNYFHF